MPRVTSRPSNPPHDQCIHDNERDGLCRRAHSSVAGHGSVADLRWERSCWRDGYRSVAGIDEAGRGALAGPIVAAAVDLPGQHRPSARLKAINDSKLLPQRTRDAFGCQHDSRHSNLLGHLDIDAATNR